MLKPRSFVVLILAVCVLAACGGSADAGNDTAAPIAPADSPVLGWWTFKATRDDGSFFLGGIIFNDDGSFELLTNYDNRYEGTYTVTGAEVTLQGEAEWQGTLDNGSMVGAFSIPATGETGQFTAVYDRFEQ